MKSVGLSAAMFVCVCVCVFLAVSTALFSTIADWPTKERQSLYSTRDLLIVRGIIWYALRVGEGGCQGTYFSVVSALPSTG